MSLTADDPVLLQIGYLAACSGRPPGEVARLPERERDFWEWWVRRERAADEDRFWTKMGRYLGTTWERGDFDERPGPRDRDRAHYPLSVLIGTGVWDAIKKGFGTTQHVQGYMPQRGEKIVDTAEMAADEFRAFLKNFGGVGG